MNKIINFHDVNDPDWLDSIISLIKSKYRIVGVDDLGSYYYSGKQLKNVCHVSIDDGDNSFYNIIYPVLKKNNVPASLFVSPEICIERKNYWFQEILSFNKDYLLKVISEYLSVKTNVINKYPLFIVLKNLRINDIWDIIDQYRMEFNITNNEPQNMNIDQLKEIDKDGLVTIGAHTLKHPILANEDNIKCESEITGSIKDLEEILDHEIKYFAYPNGLPDLDFGKREITLLRQNNCRIAFSTDNKDFTSKDNPLSIPRYGISSNESEYFVRFKLLFGDYWQKLKELKPGNERKIRMKLKEELLYKNKA